MNLSDDLKWIKNGPEMAQSDCKVTLKLENNKKIKVQFFVQLEIFSDICPCV